MTRPFYTTEEEKSHFRSVPQPLDFSLGGALRKTPWIAERAFGVVTSRLGLAVRVKTDSEEVVRLVQPENYTKFLGELSGRFWTATLMGSRCCDGLSCWMESELCENISARLQTYLGCESFGTANEHKTATRIRPSSDQAYCCAESKTKSRDSKMATSFRSEENWKKCSLPTDLGSSGCIASTEKCSGKQRTKTVNGDAGNIPAEQNSESEHYNRCDGPWRCCASTCPSLQQ